MRDKHERGGDKGAGEPLGNDREGEAQNGVGINGQKEKIEGDDRIVDQAEEEPVIELTDQAEEEPVMELVDRVDKEPVAGTAPEKSDAHKGPERMEAVGMPSQDPQAQRQEILSCFVEASVTEAELRQVVEKVVRELYSEKIEDLLVTAVEKTVSREIDRLKTLLKGDGA